MVLVALSLSQCGSSGRWPPGCIMRPVATFVNLIYTIKLHNNFGSLGMPLTVILPYATLEPAHSGGLDANNVRSVELTPHLMLCS